jgi:mRNA interferase MazF
MLKGAPELAGVEPDECYIVGPDQDTDRPDLVIEVIWTSSSIDKLEIWWADLAEPRGSEPGKRRPVLVVQDDSLTRSRLRTAMVVPITSNLKRAVALGNVMLARSHSGLSIESVALVCQVMTIDKDVLTSKVATLPASSMARVDAGLRLTLALGQ